MDFQQMGWRRDPWREQQEWDEWNSEAASAKDKFQNRKNQDEQAPAVQTKTETGKKTVVSPDDISEKEADEVSQKVVEGKTVDLGGATGNNGNPVSPKSEGGGETSVGTSFEQKLGSTESSGQKLDAQTQAEMGSKMNADFSGVKIHNNPASQELAASINAKAFTHGQDIYFGKGHSADDKSLLAHELVHTVQQAGKNTDIIQRSHDHGPKSAIDVTWQNTVSNSLVDFMNSFSLFTGNNATSPRWTADNLEKQSAFRSIIQDINNKQGATIDPTNVVNPCSGVVVFNHTPTGSTVQKTLTYTYSLTPLTPKPKLSISFASEESLQTAGSTVTSTVQAANNTVAPSIVTPVSIINASSVSPDYFTKHPTVKNQLDNYFATKITAPTTVAEYVNVGTTAAPDYFFANFEINPPNYKGAFTYVGTTLNTVKESPTTDNTYKEIGYGSLVLNSDKKNASALGDRINQIYGIGEQTGETTLPEEERMSVNYMIHTYFQDGNRDTEIDLIIPLPDGKDPVYYTIQYKPGGTNLVDVIVKRVGAKNELSGENSIDFMYDIAQINGYASKSTNKSTLLNWLKQRYENLDIASITPADTDPNPIATIRTKMHAIIKAGAGTQDWYKNQYKMKTLSKAEAITKIAELESKSSGLNATEKANVVEFTDPSQLEKIEKSLQKLENSTLDLFKGLLFCREIKHPTNSKTNALTRQKTNSATGVNASDILISIYDKAFKSDHILFAGQSNGTTTDVTPRSSRTILHEMGHAIENKVDTYSGRGKTYHQEFEAFIKTSGDKPFTDYAQSDSGEFFPEAFSLYHSDKQWFQAEHPKLFEWFKKRFN